jgi:hypothetical protein
LILIINKFLNFYLFLPGEGLWSLKRPIDLLALERVALCQDLV